MTTKEAIQKLGNRLNFEIIVAPVQVIIIDKNKEVSIKKIEIFEEGRIIETTLGLSNGEDICIVSVYGESGETELKRKSQNNLRLFFKYIMPKHVVYMFKIKNFINRYYTKIN